MNFDGGGQNLLAESRVAFLFREGFQVQFNRFADIGKGLVQGLPL